MISASLTDDNGTLAMPAIEKQFLNTPIENAVDVQTLNGNVYTDFTNQKATWEFNYDSLTEDEYNDIRAKYDAQFTLFQYPLLSIPYYSLTDRVCRMYINEKDIWNNCGAIQNVKLIFRESEQLDIITPDYLLLDSDDELLRLGGNSYLLL